jgi:hypothetical protein
MVFILNLVIRKTTKTIKTIKTTRKTIKSIMLPLHIFGISWICAGGIHEF